MAQENLNNLGEDPQKKPEGGQEEIKNETKKDLVKDLESTATDKEFWKENLVNILDAQSKGNWNINIEDNDGYKKIAINSKHNNKPRSESEVVITVKPTGKINIRYNPYLHYEEFYFMAENLSLEDYLKNVKYFSDMIGAMNPEEVVKNTSLKKINLIPDSEEFDPSEWMNDDQLGGFNQSEYDKILKEEGVEAAVKFADVNKDKKN